MLVEMNCEGARSILSDNAAGTLNMMTERHVGETLSANSLTVYAA